MAFRIAEFFDGPNLERCVWGEVRGQGDPHPSSRGAGLPAPHVVGQRSHLSGEAEVSPDRARRPAIAQRPVGHG